MSDIKKYYYLKFKENYFEQDHIKVIEAMDNGYIYSLIIIKLYLKALKWEGQLKINEAIPYMRDKVDILAKVINHDPDHVSKAITLAKDLGIIEIMSTGEMFMSDIQNFIGCSNTEADRKKEYRKRLSGKSEIKEIQHIPFIEPYLNNKKYSGNYYVAFERDKKKCKLCGSIENLIMHHIDGYNENKPENNELNKLITLCRKCHGKKHSEAKGRLFKIDKEILNSINYPGQSSDNRPPELELDKEIDIDIKKDKKAVYEKNIYLTDKEYNKLIEKHGKENTLSLIRYLSSYKKEKNYSTKSDYLTILRWVVEACQKRKEWITQEKQAEYKKHDYKSLLEE